MNKLELLDDYHATCVVLSSDGDVLYHSDLSGVAPLIKFYNQCTNNYNDLIIIDRIVGKGAMVLATLLGAKTIYTPIVSKQALIISNKYNVQVHYDSVVEYVINRDGTDMCPIEKSLLEIDDIQKAYKTILTTLDRLRSE